MIPNVSRHIRDQPRQLFHKHYEKFYYPIIFFPLKNTNHFRIEPSISNKQVKSVNPLIKKPFLTNITSFTLVVGVFYEHVNNFLFPNTDDDEIPSFRPHVQTTLLNPHMIMFVCMARPRFLFIF
jgi:hypothetical protein